MALTSEFGLYFVSIYQIIVELYQIHIVRLSIRVVRPTHQNMYHQKNSYLSKINWGLEKALFKIMHQRGVNNTYFQIVKPGRSSSLLFEIHPSYEKVPFLDPH